MLITLGIIGVVSSLTMPTLIASTRKSEYSVRLKKFYSTMSQAVVMYNSDHNMLPEDWAMPDSSSESLLEFWNTHLEPYFKNVISVSVASKGHYLLNGRSSGIIVKFSDGSAMSITKVGVIEILYDVNAGKAPNLWARDVYGFLLNKGSFSTYNWTYDIPNLKPSDGGEAYTKDLNDRKNVLRLCKNTPSFCSQLLLLDGWEFKDDYPYKI